VNPLVYASEGLRGTLMPKVDHIPVPAVIGALAAIDAVVLVAGLKKFNKKAVS
jgi:hypothetical protein